MLNTLRISFSLKNTYRVNAILHSLKQIPGLKQLLPVSLYQVRGLKIFANVLTILWELISIFLFKFLYFLTMVCGIGLLYEKVPADLAFLHILLLLTWIGSYLNTSLFNPTRDKYYAMILLRMDARAYTLINYGYAMGKVVVGFLPFTVLFGLARGVPLWLCLLIPFCVAGTKLTVAAYSLRDYEKSGYVRNENNLQKFAWILSGLLLLLAYIPLALGFALPLQAYMVLWLIWIPAGLFSLRRVVTFRYYRQINQELLSQMLSQMDTMKAVTKNASQNAISADRFITSQRKGFEYLNELFIRRHRKILWRSTLRIAYVCGALCAAILLLMLFRPETKEVINQMVMTWLPYFVFILYAINRGTGFTRALFMNCDHSLLTYAFYKQPGSVLKLFQIRLREIMKINAVPALVIGGGLALILYVSGGTNNPLNYLVLLVSTLAMSMFFSIHYLTIYYLLQPYTVGTEMKSGTYRVVMVVTYVVCYALMNLRMPILVFGVACIVFCGLYSIVACILVYKFAPQTFRLRT